MGCLWWNCQKRVQTFPVTINSQERTIGNWWADCAAGSHWPRFTFWELSGYSDTCSWRRLRWTAGVWALAGHYRGWVPFRFPLAAASGSSEFGISVLYPFPLFFLLSIHSQSTWKKITLTFAHPSSPAVSYCFLAESSWQKTTKKKTQDDFCLMGWNCTSQHDICDTVTRPTPVPLMLRGLGNVSVELERGWLSFGLLFLRGHHMDWMPSVLWVSYCLAEG